VYSATAYCGPMAVTKSVYGYRKLSKHNASLIELCDAERPLPPHSYNTRGLWLDLPVQLRDALGARGHMFARGGLHAIEHAMIALAPLCVTCDPSELGCQCTRRQGDPHAERLLLFERRAGGVGVAEQLVDELGALLLATQQRLEHCACVEGCPSCVHMAGCGEYNEGLDKPAALLILRWLLQGEDDWVAGGVSVKS